MKHALVTGGAGFIGSHLVDRLLGENWQVTVIDNFDPFYDPAIKRQQITPHLKHPLYRLIEADIRTVEEVLSIPDRPVDVVVHLAAKAGVRPSISNPLLYQDVNVRGTHSLLEFCRHHRIRQFVFASSSSVYGVNERVPWAEDDTPLPISPYASTKLSGEFLGHVYSHLFGLRFVGLRFFTVYGPRQRPDLAIRKFAQLMLEGKSVPLFGDGSASRDYTYIDDIVTGIRAAMDYDASDYEIINLGNNHTVRLLEMAQLLAAELGVSPTWQWCPEQAGDVPRTCADISKAQRLLGYGPATAFEDGIRCFVRWLHEGSSGCRLLHLAGPNRQVSDLPR